MNGIDELMRCKIPSSSGGSLIDCSIDLPRIPKRFKHLYDNLEEKQRAYDIKYAPTGICDCNKVDNNYLECPHFIDPSFVAIYQILPKRLMHLDLINPKNKDKIKWNLFCQVIHAFEHLPCKKSYPDSQNFQLTDSKTQLVLHQQLEQPDHLHVHDECHILRDLKKMFPTEYQRYYSEVLPNSSEADNSHTKFINMKLLLLGNFILGILFNAALMYVMLVTNAKVIISLVIDIFTITMMQLLHYLAYQLKSFKLDQFQYVLHNKKQEQYYSRHNYSSLASLVMGSINLSLSISTIGTIISSIIDQNYKIFKYTLVSVIVCVCIAVYMLIVGLLIQFLYIKYKSKKRTISNFLAQKYYFLTIASLVAIVGFQFNEKTSNYLDSILAIVILFASLCQYLVLIIQQMKSLVGKLISQQQMDEYMMMLLHEFTCTVFVQSVDSFIGYTSGGDKDILEINITVPQTIDIDGVHSIVQTIQSGFEKLKAVQRCHVHVESIDCVNDFETENASVTQLILTPEINAAELID